MKLIIALLLNAVALLATASIVPGFRVADFKTALLAAVILGVINTFIKPVLVFLTLPLNILTLGLFTFIINAVILWIASLVVTGVTIQGPLAAVFAAIVLSIVSTLLSSIAKNLKR